MNKSRSLAAAVFALASAIGNASADDAENAYHEGRYADALALLEERGLEGDADSQNMVGMMYLMGSRLYGDQVATDPERAARWVRAAALNVAVDDERAVIGGRKDERNGALGWSHFPILPSAGGWRKAERLAVP